MTPITTGPTRRRTTAVGAIALLTVTILAAGCANDTLERAAASPATTAPRVTAPATFTATPSIGQVTVTRAEPGDELQLVDADERVVARGTADDTGSLIFYDVPPAEGYRVIHDGSASSGDDSPSSDDDAVRGTDAVKVPDRDVVPPETLYTGQPLQVGLNYVRMRDGVTLAMTVRLPAGKALDDGPFPTLVEYSGYEAAAPHDLLTSITAQLTDPDAPSDPLAPATSTAVGGLIAPLLDFAVVSVQIRGSGCSGGAFDLFGLPTIYDGYDTIETVAAQPWVKGGKVGMVGISYSGYSQLFVGGTRPPHLAALAPMSVTADLYDGIGFPGGIFNNGFAKGWLTERQEDSKPAPEGGQRWAKELVAQGDEHCIANQLLHGQARDGLDILSKIEFREPELFDDRTPGTWAKNIDVPTFLVGGLQDEQLGSHWAKVIPDLADNPDTWVTMFNGNHNDALQPAVLTRWVEFLNLFVADRVPVVPDAVLGFSGLLFEQISHVPTIPLAQTRFAGTTDVEAARERFRKDPRIRILQDVGGGDLGPGALQPGWEMTATTWPPEGTSASRYYLGDSASLSTDAPTTDQADATYTADPAARPATSVDPDAPRPFADQPNNWTPVADGAGLGWESPPLTADVVIAGPSSLDVWLTASADNTDLQATLSEIRPDGDETYIETGWLRATHRKLDTATSTELDPRPTHLEADAEPLSATEPALNRISINPVVHAFRKGSRIRVTLTAPGGDRPLWMWKTIDDGTTEVTVHSTVASPSSLVLPVVEGTRAGGPLPACNTLRGQPCRRYLPTSNATTG
jgi:predicted acyl esterase